MGVYAMKNSHKEMEQLVPGSDAGIALLRMNPSDRLPRYKENPLKIGDDISEKMKAKIRSIGLPK